MDRGRTVNTAAASGQSGFDCELLQAVLLPACIDSSQLREPNERISGRVKFIFVQVINTSSHPSTTTSFNATTIAIPPSINITYSSISFHISVVPLLIVDLHPELLVSLSSTMLFSRLCIPWTVL